jgi:adenosylmethionine-8-amino-7-oxononanoate aminotransferase
MLLPSDGCDRGHAGDMVFIAPPVVITQGQIDELVEIVYEAVTHAEGKSEF